MNKREMGEFTFISEKIKKKPLNKKRLLLRFIMTVAMAILFGVVASVVFSMTQPAVEQWTQVQESVDIVIETTDSVESGMEQQNVQGTDASSSSVTVADVQRVYYDLYTMAKAKEACLVRIIPGSHEWGDEVEKNREYSGIILQYQGRNMTILTEQENFQNMKNVTVEFFNGDTALGTVDIYNKDLKMAAISVNIENVPITVRKAIQVAEFGNSQTVTKGMFVVAVGRPTGECFSSIAGNIIDIDEELSYVDHNYAMLTTDIPAKSYSSGFLMNRNGKIIGILTHDGDESGEMNTLKAIPISEVKTQVENIANKKEPPYLGMYVRTVTETDAEIYGIPQGNYVEGVELDSPAMQAGLMVGDIVVKIGGKETTDAESYRQYLDEYTVGEKIEIVVMRYLQEEYKEVTVKVINGRKGN